MASEEIAEMSRRAAALADERDTLMAQLRSSARPLRTKKATASHILGEHEANTGSGAFDKENEAPEWTPPIQSAATVLQHEHATGVCPASLKNVRFSSPLLTPKSNANLLRTTCKDADPAWRARSAVAAIQESLCMDRSTTAKHVVHGDCDADGELASVHFADESQILYNKIAFSERQIEELISEVLRKCMLEVDTIFYAYSA